MEREADFRDFYDAHARRVLTFAIGVTGDHAEAQDVTQEAFARAWARWAQLHEHPSPEAWVLTVVRRLASNRWRHLAVVRAWERSTRGREPHVPEPSTESVALWSALKLLKRSERDVVALHHLLGFSFAEIAELLAMPVNTVKSHAARGRRRLAAALTDPDDQHLRPVAEPQS